MPIDKSKIRKGMFMTSMPAPSGYRYERKGDEQLRYEDPEAKLKALVREREELAARMSELKAKIEAVGKRQ